MTLSLTQYLKIIPTLKLRFIKSFNFFDFILKKKKEKKSLGYNQKNEREKLRHLLY